MAPTAAHGRCRDFQVLVAEDVHYLVEVEQQPRMRDFTVEIARTRAGAIDDTTKNMYESGHNSLYKKFMQDPLKQLNQKQRSPQTNLQASSLWQATFCH